MKKVIFAMCFMMGAAVAANAQVTPTPTERGTQTESHQYQRDKDYTDKERIEASELPANITSSLEGQDYSGWNVGNAFKKEKDGETFYAVEVNKGSETKMIKFDAQGNKVKEKDKDKMKKDKMNP